MLIKDHNFMKNILKNGNRYGILYILQLCGILFIF